MLGLLTLVGLSPGSALGKHQAKIYFFTDTAEPIDAANPLVIRPHGFLMFQDGQWALERLRWSGWGTSVAHAHGFSNSSDDAPDAAGGKRIVVPATVTLSKPKRFQGHEVYSCFQLTVPATPQSDQHLCLQHVGKSTLLLTPGAGKAAASIASRAPTKSERARIAQAASRTSHAGSSKVHVSDIRVSTVGPWASATVTIAVEGGPDRALDILHLVHGRWRIASTGTAGEWCVMPAKDQRNLGFPASYPCER